MPLNDEPFERGKCGLKAIQYMGVGIPTLASPVGINKDIVLHGETGFHCTSIEDWSTQLQWLLYDEKLRKQFGLFGRKRVVENYSVKMLLPIIIKIFERVGNFK
jgi:glycosyltransferase involved in cell wall biosynthesis